MKVVDANVLIYAVNSASSHHASAHAWMTRALVGEEIIGIPWVSAVAFLRLTTNPRIMPRPLSVEQSLTALSDWLEQRPVKILHPRPGHLATMSGLLIRTGAAGNLTTDAHIAALALEHSAEVVSYDRDFQRFGVTVEVPGAKD